MICPVGPPQRRSGYWKCRTASIIFRALDGFGTNKLPGGEAAGATHSAAVLVAAKRDRTRGLNRR